MIKDKEQKKKFLDGLFDDFEDKLENAFILMLIISAIVGLIIIVVGLVSIKWTLLLLTFFCICYLIVHKLDL